VKRQSQGDLKSKEGRTEGSKQPREKRKRSKERKLLTRKGKSFETQQRPIPREGLKKKTEEKKHWGKGKPFTGTFTGREGRPVP